MDIRGIIRCRCQHTAGQSELIMTGPPYRMTCTVGTMNLVLGLDQDDFCYLKPEAGACLSCTGPRMGHLEAM
eukprot:3574100-Alexandrium_andersonii.AAC.1